MLYQGGCHCGAIRFEVEAPESLRCEDCNCSICYQTGYLHLIVPGSRFRLISGQDNLTVYCWGTAVAQHSFCKTCGIKPFYIPRSNPDGYDVNVRCLDKPPKELKVVAFDGQNWEEHAHSLVHLSEDEGVNN